MGPPSLNGGNLRTTGTTCRRASSLQWGRRLSTAEISVISWTTTSSSRASMGPPSLNGGNDVVLGLGLGPQPASMGPPSLNGGNARQGGHRTRGLHASMGPPSLNGGNPKPETKPLAVELLQWGRRLSTAEIRQRWVDLSAGLGFNGAAVSQRRKSRSAGRGSGGHRGFNGAAVSQRRK